MTASRGTEAMAESAERATLAAVLADPDVAAAVLAEPADLFTGPQRVVRDACARLAEQGLSLTPAAVAAAAGPTAQAVLAALPPPDARHVPLLHRFRLQRVAQQWGRRLLQPAADPAAVLAAAADAALTALAGPAAAGTSVGAAAARAVAQSQAGLPRLLRTGLPPLDAAWAALGPGHVVLVGARPGVGKSALAAQIARHTAAAGAGVLYVSLEMEAPALARRLLAQVAGVDHARLLAGAVPPATLAAALATLDGWPLTFIDRPGLTPAQIRAAVVRARLQGPVDVLVVDYVQLVRAPATLRAPSEYDRITAVSGALRDLARDLSCLVVACSQLRRPRDGGDRPPEAADLRGSGALEQDADAILLLHRPGAEPGPAATLWLVKNRAGATGKLAARFDAAGVHFVP